MATKKPNPFAKFEDSKKDKDTPAVTKKFGKEGSKKEEAFDKKKMGGKRFGFADGGSVGSDGAPMGVMAAQPAMMRGGFRGRAPGASGDTQMGRNMPGSSVGGFRGGRGMPQPAMVDRGAPSPDMARSMPPPPPMDRGAPPPMDRGAPPPMDRGAATAMPQPAMARGAPPPMDRGDAGSSRGFAKGGMVRRGWGKARGA